MFAHNHLRIIVLKKERKRKKVLSFPCYSMKSVMGEVGAVVVKPNYEFQCVTPTPTPTRIAAQISINKNKGLSYRGGLLLSPAFTKFKPLHLQPMRVKCQAVDQRPSTYSSRISTDIPFYEPPGASFDEYLEDKPRVFRAIFPDKRRSQQLNQEEWRVHMLPIKFLFLNVVPSVDMRLRCKTNGKDYLSGISPAISKVLELDIVRWELRGLDNVVQPTHFNLGVHGTLYSDRRGVRSQLKGQLEMKISVILPPALSLVPEDVRQSVSESVLKGLVENMKDKVNGSLLADFGKFR